jgi:peptidyl-prolyl cis-trans isomerase B (cyclophilin B)
MKGLALMFKQRSWRFLAATAAATAAIAVGTFAGGTASGAAPGGLNPPNMHPGVSTDTTTDTCGYHSTVPADRFKGIPVFNATQAAQPYLVRFITTQGIITVKMLTTAAPCTTFSFRFLASQGYYNDTHCHRLTVQEIYVLQCGDPTGTGAGAPGYSFNDENLTGATYPAGTVAMANAGPNTNGSQFFFVWKDTTLSPAYTPFGTVVDGMDVLAKIAAAGDDSQNNPGDGYPNDYTQFLYVQIIPQS